MLITIFISESDDIGGMINGICDIFYYQLIINKQKYESRFKESFIE